MGGSNKDGIVNTAVVLPIFQKVRIGIDLQTQTRINYEIS